MNKPWLEEPDRREWRYRGYPCLIVRNPMRALCGYVGVPPGHPYHGKGYDDVPADAHGGLTFAAKCSDHICHKALPGEADDVWWLGFDCSHSDDFSPRYDDPESETNVMMREKYGAGLSDFSTRHPKTYKTIDWVKAETERLADQLVDAYAPASLETEEPSGSTSTRGPSPS